MCRPTTFRAGKTKIKTATNTLKIGRTVAVEIAQVRRPQRW